MGGEVLRGRTAVLSVVLAAFALTMFAGASFGMVGAPTVRKAAQVTYKMAVVTDVGGLNDHGFNQAANAGRLLVQKKLGFQTRVFDTRSAAERLPNLQAAAQDGYQLVFGTGFFMGDPLDKVAPKFPNVKFAGIDVNYNTDLPSKPSNVRGIQFKEQEAGYLVGYMAGPAPQQQPPPHNSPASCADTGPANVPYLPGHPHRG